MAVLITSDIHLTDNPRDEDRWRLLPWIKDQVEKQRVNEVLILGDFTDAKDRHASKLVNRFVEQVCEISKLAEVFMLKANHDYIDEGTPFFKFIERMSSSVHFIIKPRKFELSIGMSYFVPNAQPGAFASAIKDTNLSNVKYIFCHQTFEGCKAENGQTMEGIPPSVFDGFNGDVYSGDIHVPQKVGRKIEYVGAPYRVRFGDEYEPRVLLLDSGKKKSLTFPGVMKHLLEVSSADDLDKLAFKENVVANDQLKIRVSLKRADYGRWTQIREEINALAVKNQWAVNAIEMVASEEPKKREAGIEKGQGATSLVRNYAKLKKLDAAVLAAGLAIIEAVK